MQICTRCIYDSRINHIEFDKDGVCNYCHEYDKLDKEYPNNILGTDKLFKIARKIKKKSKNLIYDVIVGVSGGCDSSYTLWFTKEILKLKPLAVSFNNGWNTETADSNLKKITEGLGIDLKIYKVDQEEFNDMWRSCIKASIIELDLASDVGLAAVAYMEAERQGIKYIFGGGDFRTEGISPPDAVYIDAKYLESVQKQYGTIKIKTLPMLWLSKWLKWIAIDKIRIIRPLYYTVYNKESAKRFLNKKYGWEWYGGKHMESMTSAFNNYYWSPKKFRIYREQVELAALVRCGQMSREDALKKFAEPIMVDKDFVDKFLKRLRMDKREFYKCLIKKNQSYKDFKTYKKTFERYKPFFWLMYKWYLVPKSFYEKYCRKYS